MATVAERVDSGIHLLDERVPNWRDSINLDALNISSLDNCVLAQVFGSFGEGLDALNVKGDPAREYGFDVYSRFGTYKPYDDTFANLESEWRQRLLSHVGD